MDQKRLKSLRESKVDGAFVLYFFDALEDSKWNEEIKVNYILRALITFNENGGNILKSTNILAIITKYSYEWNHVPIEISPRVFRSEKIFESMNAIVNSTLDLSNPTSRSLDIDVRFNGNEFFHAIITESNGEINLEFEENSLENLI